ncbi:MAG: eukaryotic-like serine/threonine-protein kinase [Myxococcales bacterium]|nr:eukaryotic-like serine/threonine-protein kinase [Myxococcales bacterium]
MKVGRYDVVGPLATGGMAEILLGRLVGPSGFQRPVVIKRILPHLAREKGFVEMFLDEARIVAGIRHPNVVQVHELGHEGEELFLAMEYLEGESVAGLVKRLRAHEEPLDPALAAYIVAEACAGLHAAHELVDTEGQKQNVVHRDVSPQNVFITYAGEVKILDFGIAVAADRVTRTETGTFKGKFEYSSPEQCRAEQLDRRSDVFALGILLFEVSTGKRLFKRHGQLATLRAICELPILHPSDVLPDYPPVLEKVVLQALERDRERRYPTAQAMRRDLLAAAREMSADVAPEERLASVMQRLFADRAAEKSLMLRRVEAGATVDEIPPPETDGSIEIPMAVDVRSVPPPAIGTEPTATLVVPGHDATNDATAPLSGGTAHSAGSPEPPRVARTRWTLPVVAAGAFAMVVLAGMGVVVASRNAPADPTRTSAAIQPAAVVEKSATSSVVTASAAAPAPAAPAAVVAPAEVVIRIETTPPKAHVFVGGDDRGLSPIELRMPRATAATEVEIRRDGYQTQRETVTPETDQKIKLTLVPAPIKGAAPKANASANPYKRFD